VEDGVEGFKSYLQFSHRCRYSPHLIITAAICLKYNLYSLYPLTYLL